MQSIFVCTVENKKTCPTPTRGNLFQGFGWSWQPYGVYQITLVLWVQLPTFPFAEKALQQDFMIVFFLSITLNVFLGKSDWYFFPNWEKMIFHDIPAKYFLKQWVKWYLPIRSNSKNPTRFHAKIDAKSRVLVRDFRAIVVFGFFQRTTSRLTRGLSTCWPRTKSRAHK